MPNGNISSRSAKILDFQFKKGSSKKFPMSVETTSR